MGASVVIWLIATLAGAQLTVASPIVGTLVIDLPLLIISAAPLALAAWGVLAVLERLTTRPRAVWTIIAVIVLVISLPPLALLDATAMTKAVLGLMHLATGLILIALLPRGAVSHSSRSATSTEEARPEARTRR